MALVSNVNGYMHDVKAISDLAHAQGAYVYGDIIQAAGCTPVDVEAMGIDCAAMKYICVKSAAHFRAASRSAGYTGRNCAKSGDRSGCGSDSEARAGCRTAGHTVSGSGGSGAGAIAAGTGCAAE